jgi:hypothetical protein
LRSLSDNWNGEGEKAPTEQAVAAAEALSGMALVPLHDGGVQVEVHAAGIDLEIGVGPGGQVETVFVGGASSDTGWTDAVHCGDERTIR